MRVSSRQFFTFEGRDSNRATPPCHANLPSCRAMADKTLVSLRDARERTIAVLSDLFAKDELELDEFEKRVSLVHRAPNVAEVENVVKDLPVPTTTVKPKSSTALVPASQVRKTDTLL